MNYYSTNHKCPPVSFREAVLKGLPDDNGLFMPESIPVFSTSDIDALKKAPLNEIGFEVSQKFIDGEIADNILSDLVSEAINFNAPLKSINKDIHVLELFHGPTLAFKDFGARFMARIMGHFIRNENNLLDILVATSGDTGGAVASGFYEVPGIRVTILFPKGKVSPLQEKQLTTWGKNIHSIEIRGTFDDCQALVKKAFLDNDLNTRFNLSSANSINISRLIPQSFYYFHAAGQLDSPPVFSVPSGNFGNLCAGLIAWKMGLPVEKFVAAVNQNDIFPQYLQTTRYVPKPSVQTISNAMDVGNPSNFTRLLAIFGNDHAEILKKIWSFSFDDIKTRSEMKSIWRENNYLCDPHTAIAVAGLKEFKKRRSSAPGIALSTAHPAKFIETVEATINEKIELPEALESLIQKKSKKLEMSSNFEDFKEFLIYREK